MSERIIHPTAVIEENVQLGENIKIGPNCFIGKGTKIGDGTILDANVVIGEDVVLGVNNHLFSNCVIGRGPQIFGMAPGDKYGKLIIGDNNTIRENVTIHPGMHEDGVTRVGNGNFIMVGVHIGHDCVLEDQIVMSNCTQVSGHCKIETGVWLSGMVAIHQFCTIGKWAYAAGMSGINHDVPPFMIVSGHYPCTVRSINKRGLKRAGLDDKELIAVFSVFKKLYRQKGVLLEKAKELKSSNDLDVNCLAIVDAIIKSSEHRFGRYLEQFR